MKKCIVITTINDYKDTSIEDFLIYDYDLIIVGDLKTKYTLPHLNMKAGETLEDFLLKIRDPIHDEGCKRNPEELLIELKKLDKNSSSFFSKNNNNPDENAILKQYYEYTEDDIFGILFNFSKSTVGSKELYIYIFNNYIDIIKNETLLIKNLIIEISYAENYKLIYKSSLFFVCLFFCYIFSWPSYNL